MNNFEYKATVIVPVYNVEKYLSECLNSLVEQTIDLSQIEVLLINDGSTDGSLKICNEYASIYNFIKVIDKENEGVSKTRNLGIKSAKGKYIFFLDSDDTISNNTLLSVSEFFDNHYNEIDMVAYYDRYLKNGVEEKPHMRYKYLTKTGIYDLNENPYSLQLRLSMCVKNMLGDNILFDEEMGYQEDQAYCSEILKEKLKLGFVKEAIYNYNKNENGVVAQQTNPIVMFEKTTAYFEKIFSKYKNEVPKYYQALFFHDIQWKFATSCLYPYHYDDDNLFIAKQRIRNLLRRVDSSTIFEHSNLDNYQKIYWMRQKGDNQLVPILESNLMRLLYKGQLLYQRNDVEIILKRIYIGNGYVKFIGYYKSPFFSFTDDLVFYTIENGEKKVLDVKSASSSYYHAKEKTDNFFSFVYRCYFKDRLDLKFMVSLDGIEYPISIWISPTVPFSSTAGYSVMSNHNTKIEYSDKNFHIESILEDECNEYIDKNTKLKGYSEVFHLRNYYQKNKNRNIWLYCDNYSVAYDNGWLQFMNDFEKDDGIERYYLVTNNQWKDYDIFQEKYHKYMIEFGSEEHKKLFVCASKFITAFIEHEVCYPFSNKQIALLSDILNVEFIYLQHGVLHAHLPWYYTPTGVSVDREVVSSNFEIKNLSTNYGFNVEDLIPTGMPRYDYLDKTKPAKRWVLFAPSWRSYLTGEITSGNSVRVGNASTLQKSNYFANIQRFINSPELNEVLKKNNVELHLKLHPEFYCTYAGVDWVSSSNIKLVDNKVDLTDYAAFMTDFSSFVFDYAPLCRPIMYFVPDYIEFKAGLNRYRKLDLPFEDAFGKLAKTPEDAVANLIEVINNNFKTESVYYDRMKNFYLDLENCCEGIYEHLTVDNNDL